MRQNSHNNSYSCRPKRGELQSESFKDQKSKYTAGKSKQRTPPAIMAQTRDVSEKVDVRNTDPPELLKRVQVPFPKTGSKGPLQSNTERNPDVYR